MRLLAFCCWCLVCLFVIQAAACTDAAAFVDGRSPGPGTEQPLNPPTAVHYILATVTPPQANQLEPSLSATPYLVPNRLSTQTPTLAGVDPTSCPRELCDYQNTFLLERPIKSPGRNTIDGSYRFGSTQGGRRDPHHGVEFLNSLGTSVFAAADGEVIVAGDDQTMKYGPYYNFYGNLVIVAHKFPDQQAILFTLYAHLSEVMVATGDMVQAGEQIGLVGMSGAATGSHLHFEVRLGENEYAAVRNPELWLEPLHDETGSQQGAFAGELIPPAGYYLKIPSIVIEQLTGETGDVISRVYIGTYEEGALKGQSPWNESFAVGDLPPGWYRVSFVQYGMQQRKFQVYPGALTVITFDFSDKP